MATCSKSGVQRYRNCVDHKGLSTPGNKVAENGNKLLPKTCCQKRRLWQVLRQCCRFWQQFVAVFGNNLLPFSATICCLVWTGLKHAIHKQFLLQTRRQQFYRTRLVIIQKPRSCRSNIQELWFQLPVPVQPMSCGPWCLVFLTLRVECRISHSCTTDDKICL